MRERGKAKPGAAGCSGRHALEDIAQKRKTPGILLLSENVEILYANREALLVNKRMWKAHGADSRIGALPPEVLAFAKEIREHLKNKPDAKEWERCQVVRLFSSSDAQLLLRGIGLPRSRDLLILMEHLSARPPRAVMSDGGVRLTEREQTVIQHLASGMTNKEIAEELKLSEHTIKDHLKHVMRKTDTHTRTALVITVGMPEAMSDDPSRNGRRGSQKTTEA